MNPDTDSGAQIERHQPSELERQTHWDQSAREVELRYAGLLSLEDLSAEERLVAIAAMVPLAMRVVEEARDTIERLNTENAHQRELLIEALARLEALDTLPGDPGGPFYCRDADDLAMTMRWIKCVRTDPPSWHDDEHDPLDQWRDSIGDELDIKIIDRAWLYVLRLREQLADYHERRRTSNPMHEWRPWWRTRK